MKIVVIGGTGLIGSKTVHRLQGHEVVAAAPDTGVDTITGRGLAEALDGAEVVIDVSNSPTMDERSAINFFETSGRNIIAAEQNAGVLHHVALSVVGTDRLQESGYFRAKLAQEQLVNSSPVPHTLIHATQFFEFIRSIADSSTLNGVVRVPAVKFQPMAAEEVAEEIVRAALGQAANGTIEIAGPQIFAFDGCVRKVLDYDHDPRKVIGDKDALYYGASVEEDSLLPGASAKLGSTTLDWWLAHVPPPRKLVKVPVAEPAH